MSDSMYGFSIRDLEDAIRYFSDKITIEQETYYEARQKGKIKRDCAKERELTFMRIASHYIKKELAFAKQEPVKPTKVSSNMYGFTIGFCGACGSPIGVDMKYCDKCGQKLDWEVDSNV